MPRTIDCEDCGHPYETVRDNTKYCPICRLALDLKFIDDKVANCWVCEREFAPIGRGDKTCAACCYQPKKHGTITCSFCKQTDLPPVVGGISVCHACARSTEHRGPLRRSLATKQRQRRVANAGVAA